MATQNPGTSVQLLYQALPALVNRPVNVGGCARPHCPWLTPKRRPQGVGGGRGRNHGRPWISSFATHSVVPASF